MHWLGQAKSLTRRGYEWSVVCGASYLHTHLPLELQPLQVCEPFECLHTIRAAAKGRLTSYLERRIIDPHAYSEPTINLIEPIDQKSIHFVLKKGNLLVGSIRGTAHRFETQDPVWFCSDMLRRADPPKTPDQIVSFVRSLEDASPVYFEVSGWYINPDLKSEKLFAVLMPAMVWAFTSLFAAPFSAFASLRDSNGAGRMLLRLGGIDLPGGRFYDAHFRGEVRILGLHSHQYAPMLGELVAYLQSLLRQTPIKKIMQ